MTSAFERRYRAEPDPWRTLTRSYESIKRQRTLEACGDGPFTYACELGAGLGVLAEQLAPRCERLLALDGAPTAVARARDRLAPFPHAETRVGVVPDDLPSGHFDLIVASELLYYLDAAALGATLAWLRSTLIPGGRAVSVHWTGAAPDFFRSAAATGAALAQVPGLQTVAVEHHGEQPAGGYRIDVVERTR